VSVLLEVGAILRLDHFLLAGRRVTSVLSLQGFYLRKTEAGSHVLFLGAATDEAVRESSLECSSVAKKILNKSTELNKYSTPSGLFCSLQSKVKHHTADSNWIVLITLK
jgi:hypothetical protein